MSNDSTKIKEKPYHLQVANRFVGEVEDGKFKKRIQFSKHALHTPPALALSVESLVQAERFGAQEIEITDLESGRVFLCTLEHFKRYSWQLQRGGFEPQRAMALDRWTVTAPITYTQASANVYQSNQTALLTEPVVKKAEPVQLSFI